MKSYPKTKKEQLKYWTDEIASAKKRLRKCHERGESVVKRYIDERSASQTSTQRLNLFHSNVTILKSMMFGDLPKIEVSRTYQDPSDDVGRVASLLLQRALTNDVEENGKEFRVLLRSVLEDRLVPGLGCARVRYNAEFADEEYTDEEGRTQTQSKMLYETAETEYHHWRDVLWGWARRWEDVPWIAFRTFLSQDEIEERFDAKTAKKLEYKQQVIEGTNQHGHSDTGETEPMEKAELWEIWCRETEKVHWFSEGAEYMLDEEDDPLELTGFYPCPPFLMANTTTSIYQPTPDFYIVQDLYNEIDRLETRIHTITKAVKVAGAYDAANAPELKRMVQEAGDNELVPVENWAMLAEKGGMKGVVDFFPLQDIVNALETLERVRDSKISLLFQIIGLSDIMRGQGTNSSVRVSAAEQELKAKFGSVRVQAQQEEFGQFASDLMQLKAEIMMRHFSPETIGYMAIVKGLQTPDLRLVPKALELIKDPDQANLRVKIRPESVAMTDYGQLQSERGDYIANLSLFLQSASPLLESAPQTMPYMLELLKWGLSAYRSGNEVEGIMDRAIEDMRKNPPKQKDDNGEKQKLQQEQMKAQAALQKIKATLMADLQKIKAKLAADLQVIQAKASVDAQKELTQAQAARIEEVSQLEGRLAEIDAEHNATMEEIGATLQADKDRARVQARASGESSS